MTHTFTTITGELIEVSSDKSNRTFTIRKRGAIYRTIRLSELEFLECENMNGNNWNYFIRTKPNMFI